MIGKIKRNRCCKGAYAHLFGYFAAVLLAIVLTFTLVACTDDEENASPDPPVKGRILMVLDDNDIREWEDGFVPYKVGFRFLGWYADSEFQEEVDPTSLKPREDGQDVKIYAKWAENLKMESIVVGDTLFVYDGTPHLPTLGGVPEGAEVTFYSDAMTDAGTYIVRVRVSLAGYDDWQEEIQYEIKKAKIEGLSLSDAEFEWDGAEHKLEVAGDLPDGAYVVYPNGNSLVDEGTLNVVAHVYGGKNREDVELTATLTVKPKFYTVTFVHGGGREESFSVKRGTGLDEPPVPDEMRGYTAEWENDSYKFVLSDLRIEAIYTPIVYPLHYDLGGGSADNPQHYTVEESVTLNPATRDHYEFVCWRDENGSQTTGIEEGSVGERTFVAEWKPIEYVVTFELDGGTNDPSNLGGHLNGKEYRYTIESEDLVLAPASKRGFVFDGWYENDRRVEIVDSSNPKDMTLVARWRKQIYHINYELGENGVNGDNPSEYDVESEDIILKPASRLGYEFLYWRDASGSMIDKIPAGSVKDFTLYAVWQVVSYAITYDLSNGVNAMGNPTKHTIEDDALPLFAASKRGYVFERWETDSGEIMAEIPAHSVGEIRLRAVFEAEKYDITYETGGVQNDPRNPLQYTVEKDVPLFDLEQLGYNFLGWQKDNEVIKSIPKGSVGAIKLTALWEVIYYDVHYELKGGTNALSNPDKYTVENNVELSAPAKRGYNFVHWEENGEPTSGIEKGSVGPHTFTAVWELEWYDIIYEIEQGENNKDNPAKHSVESDDLPLYPATRKGYAFVRWESENGPIDHIPAGSVGEVRLRAIFEAEKYRIDYNLENGVNDFRNPSEYTIEQQVELFAPSKRGYDFLGWQDGDGRDVSSIPVGSMGDVELFAKWQLVYYDITYQTDGGDNADNPSQYSVESEFVLSAPTKRGYRFLHWHDENGEIVAKIEAGRIGDLKLTAVWEIETYSIEYVIGENGENNPQNPQSYNVTSGELQLYPATRRGYIFSRWENEHGETVQTIPANSVGKIKLTAVWNLENYTVTYVLGDNATNDPKNPTDYNIESEDLPLYPPTREGYTFSHWTDDDGDTISVIRAGNVGNMTLTAVWDLETFSIEYVLGDNGVNSPQNPQSYNVASGELQLYPATRRGYIFSRWVNEEGETVQTIPANSVGKIKLTAVWELETYSVTYVLGDNATNNPKNPTDYNIESGDLTLYPPTREGYTFSHWTDEKGHTISVIRAGSVGNLILTAFWDLDEPKDKYGAAFTAEGGKIVAYDGSLGSEVTIPRTVNGETISAIADGVLGAGIETLIVEAQITEISRDLFANCTDVRTLVLPDSIVSIAEGAFANLHMLEDLTVPFVGCTLYSDCENGEFYSFAYMFASEPAQDLYEVEQYRITFIESAKKTEPMGCSYVPSSLKRLIVLHGLIFDSALLGFTSLEEVTCECGVDDKGLRNCTSLKKFTMQSGDVLKPTALYGCKNVTELYLPASVSLDDLKTMLTKTVPSSDVTIYISSPDQSAPTAYVWSASSRELLPQ